MPQDKDHLETPSSETAQSPLPEYLILLALVAGSLTAGINAFPF
ncbi:hypothetical protein [Acuticoccus sp. I52.16.1]|nr:hypothetical protein [Acuticoccus sp. I52.16.1]